VEEDEITEKASIELKFLVSLRKILTSMLKWKRDMNSFT